MPRELTAAQSVYLAAFERHLRAVDSPLEDVAVESKQDRLGRVLADAGVTPKRRPPTADDSRLVDHSQRLAEDHAGNREHIHR